MITRKVWQHGPAALLVVLSFVLTGCGAIATNHPGRAACWEYVDGDVTNGYCSDSDESGTTWDVSGSTGEATVTICFPDPEDYCDTEANVCIVFVEYWNLLDPACIGQVVPIAPALWASALCEPDDGFSYEGWLTLDTNVGQTTYDSMLYVAAGPEGPWSATEFLQPPYVMSHENVEALAAWMGLTDYHDLWFRVSEAGMPARLGSMIVDREGDMAALCGE